jgi:hypothetical protein
MFAELAGNRIVGGVVQIPTYGAPLADVTLDKEVPTIGAKVKLTLGSLVLVMSPWREVVPFQGKTIVRLIGGAAAEATERQWQLAHLIELVKGNHVQEEASCRQ